MLRKLALKNKSLNKPILNKFNNISHTNKIFSSLKSFNSNYSNFENFISDFENYLSKKIDTPPSNLNTHDKIFEGIINRLDCLSDYKNLIIKIYLESQKNPKYFFTINKFIHNYFKTFLKSPLDLAIAYLIYLYAFNVWIEDNNEMDKTMAAIGNSFENLNKIQNLFIKK